MKHTGATHIIDIAAGSAAFAITSASLGLEYDGVAASGAHANWLNLIMDRAILYICSISPEQCETIGADASVCEKVQQ